MNKNSQKLLVFVDPDIRYRIRIPIRVASRNSIKTISSHEKNLCSSQFVCPIDLYVSRFFGWGNNPSENFTHRFASSLISGPQKSPGHLNEQVTLTHYLGYFFIPGPSLLNWLNLFFYVLKFDSNNKTFVKQTTISMCPAIRKNRP